MVNVYRLPEDRETKIGSHFKVKEFSCRDNSPTVFVSPELVSVLESVRAHFGKPLIINSGFRTYSYNKKIGGAPTSYHCCGLAADVRLAGVSPKEVAAFVRLQAPDRYGVGVYTTFTHIDVRPKRADWTGV